MKYLMNMTDCRWDEERFRDGRDAADFAGRLGFDGMELMHCEGGDPFFFPPELIGGLHLRCRNDWLDLWNGDLEAVEKEYGSLETAEKICGGLDRQALLKPLREDLELADRLQVPYVVFHVCDVKPVELYTGRFLHTDEEVIDASAELINTLLDGQGYSFAFLMENLWWPGLTMTRPEMTGRLLDGVHYPNRGIMLDTGHLMHTNLDLTSEEEAVEYILEQVRRHGRLADFIRGIHLNQSITGQYVRELLERREPVPENYAERQEGCYRHVFQIDSHLPFSTPEVRKLTKALDPEYVTFEFITCDREEYERKALRQWKMLGKTFNSGKSVREAGKTGGSVL